jgi:aminoglycoside phosphotransferase family enzyme/predicted kinase
MLVAKWLASLIQIKPAAGILRWNGTGRTLRRALKNRSMRDTTPPQSAAPLATRLNRRECFPHPIGRVQLIETHISWVVLSGTYAYKIKKPVNLGFVDFTTLGLRRYYCEEELRLNRRLAPDLYLEVVEIRGTPDAPRISGTGPLLDCAVKMREFPQDALAARLLERGRFGAPETDALARRIAQFHAAAPAAISDARLGSAAAVLAPALDNFHEMQPLLVQARDKAALLALEQWTRHEFEARRSAIEARRQQGFVRECHGDLHLGNIAVIGGAPVPFDCIEFNDAFRWIDVMSEVAFLFMDLVDREHPELAWRFLNRYLEQSGDYGGLEVFRFYLVYRALVRAKIHLLRSRQPYQLVSARSRLKLAFNGYVRLAESLSQPAAAALYITHGVSGSGKTTATDGLLEQAGAVRVRSDIERKRLHGLDPLARSGSSVGAGIYTPQATAATYARLEQLAQIILTHGYSVVVDAAFLKRAEREPFRAFAERSRVPLTILGFDAPDSVLRQRVAQRAARGGDASEAGVVVLERQLAAREPPAAEEIPFTLKIDSTRPVAGAWQALLKRRKSASAVRGARRAGGGRAPGPGR